ncbi:hypothetical protein GLAREA_03387 [Glarea lozoyensis ATCC 20868]|uniref:Uncharacterized protein n=1 Tax=Glarea lozoyensis (strain ATCC 20868 / MF5171) TaxID=1116229 RepID=S3CXU7_GLAL2|nr:uncharacterized protein GLAREA_03387 [Glarea lozoyensis ATCC 20868]EPE30420.1 hypothetical protein GLAREA_03387 [Glarea lozoyensis ATCC 20868]
MGIKDLPNELLIDILELVVESKARDSIKTASTKAQNILPLIYASKHFHIISEVILYRMVRLASLNSLTKFLRTVLARPSLGLLVQRIELKNIKDPDKISTGTKVRQQMRILRNQFPGTKELEAVKQAVKTHGLSSAETRTWLSKIEQKHWWAIAPLVIFVLPNVDEVYITDFNVDMNKPWIYFKQVLSRSQRTGKLKSLRIQHLYTTNGEYFERTEEEPCVHSMILDMLTDIAVDTFEINRMRAPPTCELRSYRDVEFRARDAQYKILTPQDGHLSLRSLKIVHSTIATDCLRDILRRCPLLEVFHFGRSQYIYDQVFRPQYLVHSLRHLKRTLKELTVYGLPKTWSLEERPDIQECELANLGSLTEFEALKELTVSDHLLMEQYPIDIRNNNRLEWRPTENLLLCNLPKSLETLRIVECDFKLIADQIKELMSCEAEKVPKLKNIVIALQWEMERGLRGSANGLVTEDMLCYGVFYQGRGFFRGRRKSPRLAKIKAKAKELEALCKKHGVKMRIGDIVTGEGVGGQQFVLVTWPKV